MSVPASFSSTGESPFIEDSPSAATVRLSPPSGPASPTLSVSLASRRVSFSATVDPSTPEVFTPTPIPAPLSRHRISADFGVFNSRPSSPPPTSQSRNRLGGQSRISQSSSIASLMMLVRSKTKTPKSPSNRQLPFGLEGEVMSEGVVPTTGWFGKACNLIRPWGDDNQGDSDSATQAVPEEQKLAFAQTREAVFSTLKKLLGVAGDIALEALLLSGHVMEYIPVPYLQKLSECFMAIWRAVEQVSTNRVAFLRLVQTCTTILDAIYKELEGADEDTAKDLAGPITVLERSFYSFLALVQNQVDTPFLWRYAKRDETIRSIADCNESLVHALTLFTTTIQLRTYQAVCHNAKVYAESYKQLRIIAEHISTGSSPPNVPTLEPPSLSLSLPTHSHMEAIHARRSSAPEGLPPSSSHESLGIGLTASPTVTSRSTDDLLRRASRLGAPPFGGSQLHSTLRASPTIRASPSKNGNLFPFVQTQVDHPFIPVLQEIQATRNKEATKMDMEDLRRSMRAALDTGNDGTILTFLGIDQRDIPEAIKTLQRMREDGHHDGSTIMERSASSASGDDTLHKEFVETGIDALRRMSVSDAGIGIVADLPRWTITVYEVEKGQKIGMGFFSEVFQGRWKGRTVAIKVLSEYTPPELFVREIKVWKSLVHPNVLKLYGASSATGNHPWFFVSPYMKNGNLVEFLRRLARKEKGELVQAGLGPIAEGLTHSKSRGCFGNGEARLLNLNDAYRILQECAKGMEYLHERGVLHGDLKASNVLVDDDFRCVLSDFGQSELKSEVCRITGSSMQLGTSRWKAPELLDGFCMLTPATDVYAYAIVCIEVLTMGELPWAGLSDDELRHNVLEKKRRPPIPPEFSSPLLHEMINACWHPDSDRRPGFSDVVLRLQRLRIIVGDGSDPSITHDEERSPTSPARHLFSGFLPPSETPRSEKIESFAGPDDFVALPSAKEVDALRMQEEPHPNTKNIKMPAPVHYSKDLKILPSHATDMTGSEHDYSKSGRHSPPPLNQRAAEARNERRYRYLLEHEFNTSLTLPLWEPSSVHLGDVGYLSKPSGAFVTLFNAIKPPKYLGNDSSFTFSSMAGYGTVSKGVLRLDKRNAAQKGFDAFSGLLSFRSRPNEMPIARRHSFRLRPGHKCAHICLESAEYQYMKKLDAPKAWFRSNVDGVLNLYGADHNIQKEDVFLVISLLQTKDYGLFVSHRHPDGQAHFNVLSAPRKGQPWGHFTSDRGVPGGDIGPSYDEPEHVEHDFGTKVSLGNGPPKAVLLGKLRFKPDSIDPTTAK